MWWSSNGWNRNRKLSAVIIIIIIFSRVYTVQLDSIILVRLGILGCTSSSASSLESLIDELLGPGAGDSSKACVVKTCTN